MIPYEELVVALQTWRARQGLPVTQLSGALTPPPVVAAPRPAPPAAAKSTPPPAPAKAVVPPPLERPSEDHLDVEDAALLDDGHYEPEGDNFSMKFAEVESDGESTNIQGEPASRDTIGLDDPLNTLHEHTEDLGEPTRAGLPSNRPNPSGNREDW